MAFTSVTLTHTFVNANGTAASGSVRFMLNTRMTNGTTSIMPATEVTANLNGAGALSAVVAATDDTGTISVGGAFWHVIIAIAGAKTEEYDISVPHSAPGGTADLMTLIPSSAQVG
jgi:hypothetical protein